jgi:hypothetical protein
MALTRTSLAAAASATDTLLSITSTSSGFPAVGVLQSKQRMLIDSEYMMIDQVIASGSVKVMQRGLDGTAAVAHGILASVATSGNNADFPALPIGEVVNRSPDLFEQVTLGADNTTGVTTPIKNTNTIITKGSACLFTITAPSVALNGLLWRFSSATAFAHVMTATALIENGLTGSPFTTGTFGAFIGAGCTLMANNGVWNVVALPVAASVVFT